MSYDICYIDDRLLPAGAHVDMETQLIDGGILESLLGRDGWQEPTLKRLLSHTFKKAKRFTQISVTGFTSPNFFLNHFQASGFEPRSIILDWDFGTTSAEESLDEILRRTSSKIFVLTGHDLIPEVEQLLVPIRQKYRDRGLAVYKKTAGIHKVEKDTQENLLEDVIADLTTTVCEIHEFEGIRVLFHPSHVLPNFESFWMFRSIVGDDHIKRHMADDELTINLEHLEEIFNESEVKFYLSKSNDRLYSEGGLVLQNFYEDEALSEPLSPLYALRNYDLAILETATEKGTSRVFDVNEV